LAISSRAESLEAEVRAGKILPRHLAIIMDGNGRWARKRKLPRIVGHTTSRQTVRLVVRNCARIGIPTLTLYTFSQENWKRPRLEVQALMKLLEEVLESEYLELNENNIRLTWMGKLDGLPDGTRRKLLETSERLANNTGMVLNLALSYGGRCEIVDAARAVAEQVRSGQLDPQLLTEEIFASHLYLPDLPEPDFLIRTSGEQRISNFLLWQMAYTEFVFLETLWPDFGEKEFVQVISEYQRRERRFGGT
jgi:undecaprenyl diphosphate synthase